MGEKKVRREERERLVNAPTLTPFPLGHLTLTQFLLHSPSRGHSPLAGACP